MKAWAASKQLESDPLEHCAAHDPKRSFWWKPAWEIHIVSNQEKAKWIEDNVVRETSVLRMWVEDTVTATMNQQEDMRNAKMV